MHNPQVGRTAGDELAAWTPKSVLRRMRKAPPAVNLRADKGYDYDRLRERNRVPTIPRRGIESSERLGRYRRQVERSLPWLFNDQCLTAR
ncbi:hypothetical protein [Streptomyces sp. NPDC101149]|uniref:hypothetical protein n=1 Tax=Streptomyces sp. NPDC101149 TaxID=3366113 RepID=UPI00381587E0